MNRLLLVNCDLRDINCLLGEASVYNDEARGISHLSSYSICPISLPRS